MSANDSASPKEESSKNPKSGTTQYNQTMPARKKAQVAFASAMVMLFLSALATYVAFTRLNESEKRVIHTFEVRAAIGDIDSVILKAGRARGGWANSEDDSLLGQFEAAVLEIPVKLRLLRELTADNPKQQEACTRLEELMAQRVALLRRSVQLTRDDPQDLQGQANLVRQNVPISSEMTSLLGQMRDSEEELLETRQSRSRRLFMATVVVLAIAFIGALELFAVHYRFLNAELRAREQAEQFARNSEESLRRLTVRLLQLQDEERRKFSRELHDSLGQYLAGIKMNLEMFRTQRRDDLLVEALQLLDHSIAETRTISHLLHPPLLDEAGFSSAAKWYVEGFAQRSGIEVTVDLPKQMGSLPKPVALGLFRILQESLTNIHRHSGSAKAEVAVTFLRDQVILRIRDYGNGIGRDPNSHGTSGNNSGVGLAGMRERMRELGGQLTIQSCNPGTLIAATMPLPAAATDPVSTVPESAQLGK